VAGWKRLVNAYVIPAFGPQLDPEKFNPHADWVGAQLMADKWTTARAEWCLSEVTRHYRKVDNLMAMLCQVSDGQKDRDGNVTGGWHQSKVYLDLCAEFRLADARKKCIAELADGFRDRSDCGRQERCAGCAKLAERPGWRAGGGFAQAGQMVSNIVKQGGD
jgi:hypothetical protein